MKKYIEAMNEVYRRCLRHYHTMKKAGIPMSSYKARVQYEEMISAIISVMVWDDITLIELDKIYRYRDEQHKTFFSETK